MLRIDPRADVAPFEQLKRQLTHQIGSGELPPGARLPSVRRLAGDLGLAPNTVARTYRELEAAGLVATHGRNGTVVRSSAGSEPEPDQRAASLTAEYARRMTELGLAPDAVLRHVRHALSATR